MVYNINSKNYILLFRHSIIPDDDYVDITIAEHCAMLSYAQRKYATAFLFEHQ